MGRHLRASAAVLDDASLPWTVSTAIRGPGTIVTGPRRSATGRHVAGAEPAHDRVSPATAPAVSTLSGTRRRRAAGRARGSAPALARRGAAVLPLHALGPSTADPSPADGPTTRPATEPVDRCPVDRCPDEPESSHPAGSERARVATRPEPDLVESPVSQLPVRRRPPRTGVRTQVEVEDRPDLDILRRVLTALHRL